MKTRTLECIFVVTCYALVIVATTAATHVITADRVEAQAHDRGYSDGYAQGYNDGMRDPFAGPVKGTDWWHARYSD